MHPGLVFLGLWLLWVLSWAVAAIVWNRPVERRAGAYGRWGYGVAMAVGAVLLFHTTSQTLAAQRLWHVGFGGAYVLAAATGLGV